MNENTTLEQEKEKANYYKNEYEQLAIKYKKDIREKNKEISLLKMKIKKLENEKELEMGRLL